jgi:Spy/CpxP family protein refolding chaperone
MPATGGIEMKRFLVPALAAAAMLAAPASFGQQPYTGFQSRPIKALSEQQIADLKAGRGMGLALAAEVNGYPGPVHVLELADALHLSEAQRQQIEQLFAAMKAEAVPLGERLIAQEAQLDREFGDRSITPPSLAEAVEEIGATQAALRTAHLKYHLSTADVLTPAQVKRYSELRGYAENAPPRHDRHQ